MAVKSLTLISLDYDDTPITWPVIGDKYKDQEGNVCQADEIRDGFAFWRVVDFAKESETIEGKTRLDVWSSRFDHFRSS